MRRAPLLTTGRRRHARGLRQRAYATLVGVALCALPVHGNPPPPPSVEVVHVLTAAAAPPTKAQILAALQGAPPIPALLGYALDARVDFGARLRATRAITEFCPELPNQCRQGILAVLDHAEGGTLIPPQRVLLLRTGIELLADAGSGLAADRMRLLAYLESPHRDVRFAAARALEHLRDPAACEVLRRRDEVEPVSQVKQAIGAAIALADCGG